MEQKSCSCGKDITRVWRVDRYEIDDRPFGDGREYPVHYGYEGDCGEIHTDFDVYPYQGSCQCLPVEVSRATRLTQAELPDGVTLLEKSYRRGAKPPIDDPILKVIGKLKIRVQDGKLVINLASNGTPPLDFPISLQPEGCSLKISNLNQLVET